MKRVGKGRGKPAKRPYPTNEDIIEALMAVLYARPYLHPSDFVEEVKRELEAKGFYAGLVNARRVWGCYERLVKKGRIPDLLSVLSAAHEAIEGSEELSS